MPRYLVNHAYRSRRDGQDFGPYEPGTTVELEPADAEWVNRDSPGCLTAQDEAPPVEDEPAQEQSSDDDAPSADEPATGKQTRPHKAARTRGGA